MFSIIIYTHSDYFDILPIQLAYFAKLADELADKKVYLLSDKPYPPCKYKTILYDGTKPYASRLLCLEQLDDEYIIIIHENDILVRFNNIFIEDIIPIMRTNEIDSVELKHDTRGGDPIPINAQTSMLKKCEYYFNVQPTLWKRERLMQLLNTFPQKTYRTIELGDLQKHVIENYKTYTLSCIDRMRSIWYEFPAGYCYLHLTSRLMLLPCRKENGLHPEIQEEHEKIFTEYLQYSARSMQDSLYSYNNSLVESSKE